MEIYHGFFMLPSLKADDAENEGFWPHFRIEIERTCADGPRVVN